MTSDGRYLRNLAGLKKLRSLRDVEESPVETRFNQPILSKWAPLLSSLVAQYSIPGRLDPQDLKQELIVSIWKLTTRVDPVSRATDFDRMCRTELRNKCVDMNRHAKARKRMGRTGFAVQCGVCGGVCKVSISDPFECKYCGETTEIRKVETYSKDVTFADSTDDDGRSQIPVTYKDDPTDSLITAEMIESIKEQLDGKDLDILMNMLNPSKELIDLLLSKGYTGDHRQAPLTLLSAYHNITERDVSNRIKKIKLLVVKLCEGSVSSSVIARATSRQGR